jgi:hypothetical protein
MTSRLATDDEVASWREHGWVVLDALIDVDEIDVAAADLPTLFPTPADYHADPLGTIRTWKGVEPEPGGWRWPDDGPGFRPDQHRWHADFPFSSAALNRLCVHASLIDFAERTLGTREVRLYQVGLSAKYAGETNYEQPMHTDRNHSFLPAAGRAPLWHLETFLYLSDVAADTAPTHLVSVQDSAGRSPTVPLFMPSQDPELYAAERPATGVRGSVLCYRPDVFHRAVDLTRPGGSRFLYNVSYKIAGQDWVGYDSVQCRANSPHWDEFVAGSTPRELEVLGFPPPGHPIWDDELLAATALRYPGLDLSPWTQRRS